MSALTEHMRFAPGDICRADDRVVAAVTEAGKRRALAVPACLVLAAGSAAYGFTFGYWRGGLQSLYSAIKMPLLMFSVVGSSALVNTMLAQLAGARVGFRQVCLLMLTGFSITAALLGALSPVVLFLVTQAPPPDPAVLGLARLAPRAADSMAVYFTILFAHIVVVGACGVLGNIQLYRILRELLASRRLASTVLVTWLLTSCFVGCELSWLLSPFMCEPVSQPHIVSRLYTQTNFYEYTWRALSSPFNRTTL